MAIIGDSGAIYGLYDRRDSFHSRLRAAVERERDRIVIPSPLLGEIGYLLRERLGVAAVIQFLADVEEGAFEIEPVGAEDLERCRELLLKYSDLDLGICDAVVVAVADRVGTNRILTVDERDFRAIRSARGRPFRLIPADR